MNIIIKETGATYTLTPWIDPKTGTDTTGDIIGNSGATQEWEYDDAREMYIVPRDDAEWWNEYITDTHAAMARFESTIDEYAEIVGADNADAWRDDANRDEEWNDYETHADIYKNWTTELRDLITAAQSPKTL
jgi:hypothetical protein